MRVIGHPLRRGEVIDSEPIVKLAIHAPPMSSEAVLTVLLVVGARGPSSQGRD